MKDKKVIKTVECTYSCFHITVGKEYQVLNTDRMLYLLRDDKGITCWYNKELFKDIKEPKMFYIRVNEEECRELPERIAMRATIIDDDYQAYKDIPLFIALYKANKKTKKALEDFKFDMRHSNTKN